MSCFCHDGHGPFCPYFEPFCTACGQRRDEGMWGHVCTAARYCGRCGEQIAGPTISPHTHHVNCAGAGSVAS